MISFYMSLVSVFSNWYKRDKIINLQNENQIGMELTRVDGVGDPFEGSNVTLSCRTYSYTTSFTPPRWSYRVHGKEQFNNIDGNNPPEGLQLSSIGVADSL